MISRCLTLMLLASTSALAQMGAATPPATPGTSLGSGAPSLPKPPAASGTSPRCEQQEGEAREECLRVRGPSTPATPGAPSSGMAGGASGGGSGSSGPGTGTAPGMTTR